MAKPAENKITVNAAQTNKQTHKKIREAERSMGESIRIRRRGVFMHVSRHLPKYKHTETQTPIPLCKGCRVRTPWVVRLKMISTQYDVVKQSFKKKRDLYSLLLLSHLYKTHIVQAFFLGFESI